MPGKSRSSIRPRLFSFWMIVTLLIQAGLPVSVQALPLAAPDQASQIQPPSDVFIDCSMVMDISQAECDALVDLYNQTGGVDWNDHTGWLDTDTPCSWFGVSCSEGYITMISLDSNNLTGSLPDSLWSLSHLVTLNLSGNSLTGGISSALGQLTSLRYLFLNNNELSGPIPTEIGSLVDLQQLQLQVNSLSGNLPSGIGGLVSLQLFYMNTNEIDGEFPDTIVNLTQLTQFAFDCMLTSSDPFVIAFINNIVPGWQNEICLPPGSVVSISGNAGAASVVLTYFDESLKTFTAAEDGYYSFEVTYGWNGMLTPSLEGYYFTPGCRDYGADAVIGNRIQQDFIALPNPPLADTPDDTSRASLDGSEVQGNCSSAWSSSSSNGRYIAFTSGASSLVSGDTNGFPDVFVRDTQSGTTTRVSVHTSGVQGNGASGPSANQDYSSGPSISGDGRYVVFNSAADNLVDGDTNGASDVFVRDLQSGTTTRVSVASDGAQGNGDSFQPVISADGRYVAFNSNAANLVTDDTNSALDVFVRDLQSGTTTRVSVDSSGAQANNSVDYWSPSISGNGSLVAFGSDASNLVSGDTNNSRDIFVHNLVSGSTILVSQSVSGLPANSFSYRPSISADGNHIAFASLATNLVSLPVNNVNVYVRHLLTAETELVSVDLSGDFGVGPSAPFSISADGRYVAFDSFAGALVDLDQNDYQDAFVRDMQTGRTVRVSVDSNGGEAAGESYWAAISADARLVSFTSLAADLVATDTNGVSDIFVVNHAALSDPPAAFSKTSPSDMGSDQTISPTLEWEASFGAATYEYCYDTSDDDDCAAWIDNQAATSVTLNNLNPGSTYFWHVRANNIGGTTYSNGSETAFWSFTIPCYTLLLTALPPWGGSINASPAPNCSNGTQYSYGSLVTVTGVPNPGYGFTSWSGDASGSENPIQVSMTASKVVNASFSQTCFSLFVAADPATGGSVTADPQPNCPGDPARYSTGTTVTLTAVPETGYSFSAWSGDVSGTANPVDVSMTADRFVTATFAEACYTLTTNANPAAGGTVTASPAPNCASDSSKYHAGSVVTLTANAGSGYSFTSWSGDASGSVSPLDVTLDADKSVTANFVEACFALTTQSSPLAGGSVNASPAPNCTADPTRYIAGTTVTLTAVPATGYVFTSWSGDASGSTNPATVVMSADRAVTASFDLACYTLTTSANPAAGGTINASPAPNCNSTQYTHGTVVTLTATPSTGYVFNSWSGSVTGTTNPTTVTMTATRSVTADFTQTCYTLTKASSPAAGGTINASPAPNCNGTQYTNGTVVTLTAVPNSGYSFTSWSGSATGTANPTTVTMTANRSVTASFVQACYSLTKTANPSGGGSINASPAPNCNGGTQYISGTVVTLTAVPQTGYMFYTWSGAISGTTNPSTLTMSANRAVTANFVLNNSPLVTRISRISDNPTSQYKIKYQVDFSQAVYGMDASDFVITTYGVTQTRVAKIESDDDMHHVVTVITGKGSGALRLDIVDNDSIRSLSTGVPLGGAGIGNGNYNGEVFMVWDEAYFLDVPSDHWARLYVESLFVAGVTAGCQAEPPYYCPDASVTRAQMAIFLLRSKYGSAYTPPAATGKVFSDVPKNYWAAAWIERVAAEGISGGCGGGKFCPESTVTRDQMAVFLLRARHGSSYNPPTATGMFTDVPTNYWAAAWIEQLAREGITSGCGGGKYCPTEPVNRAQMSVFLIAAFDLPLLGELP